MFIDEKHHPKTNSRGSEMFSSILAILRSLVLHS
jgi:hypothetical protein